jgi:hypothetical protein
MALVAWKLKVKPKNNEPQRIDEPQTIRAKLRRIDFLGATFMSTTILSAMLVLDMGGEKVAWTSPVIIILAGLAVISGLSFYVVEKFWAKEPIFPLRLLFHRDVALDYVLMSVQIASQMAVGVPTSVDASCSIKI